MSSSGIERIISWVTEPGRPRMRPARSKSDARSRVHVARIAAAPGDLLACRRELTQRLAVARDVGEDDEHVESALEREVLGDGQRGPRRQQPLDRGIVGDD